MGPFLADAILGSPGDHKEPLESGICGNDASAYLPQMLKENRPLWEGVPSYLYADSASSAGKYLEAIDGAFEALECELATNGPGRLRSRRPRCQL